MKTNSLKLIPSAEGATPAMAQWFDLKKQEPDALLFFRMGDFYELFFADAQTASLALDISLTARGKHNGEPIPMCGVPVAAAGAYLARLIRRGFRVAVAEQTQTPPSKGGAPQKGPLSRAIIRLVTRGTLTEDELLEASRSNLLLSLVSAGSRSKGPNAIGGAWLDVSTGTFETCVINATQIEELLAQTDPAEILADSELIPAPYQSRLAPHVAAPTLKMAHRRLTHAFGIKQVGSLGNFNDEELRACAHVIAYVTRTQAGQLPRLGHPIRIQAGATLGLDPATRHSLDLLVTRDGSDTHTLLRSINHTVSSAGHRLLARWISAPLTDPVQIGERQAAWQWLAKSTSLTLSLQNIIAQTPDVGRALGRLSINRGLPRNLAAIRTALHAADTVSDLLQPLLDDSIPPLMRTIMTSLYRRADRLVETLDAALSDTLPARLEEGGVIAAGYDAQLDRLHALRDDSRQTLIALQATYAKRYEVSALKVRHHAQLGFIIEASATHATRLKGFSDLIFRQGTANLVRYTTEELASLDRAINEADGQVSELERVIFNRIVEEIVSHQAIPELADTFALLDVLLSAARLKQGGRWCCPEITTNLAFTLEACRHPVVEAALDEGTHFIPNDCNLSPDKRVMLLTGPNMAGKSTFLRQTALAVILAQAGLPVPARKAKIGIVDRLFSRVGTADELAKGRSTFMVEMIETAAILRQAGPRSLVVVDEIGRGTSTSDGLAIAWATLEALHSQLGARTLFATHFHELGRLVDSLPRLAPFTMAIRQWRGDIVFLHEVKPGSAQKSWGVYVAKLAGVPDAVVERAQRLLAALERDRSQLIPTLPLLDTHTPSSDGASILLETLEKIEPNELTPKEALDQLFELRKLALEIRDHQT